MTKQNIRREANEDFPYTGTSEQKLRFLVGYAILAPSNHNTQPWKFCIRDDSLEVSLNKSNALSFIDPQLRQLTISCGAAIYMFEVAAKYFGYQSIIQLFEVPSETIANITLGGNIEPDSHDIKLFKAIFSRQTNRRFYAKTPIAESILQRCANVAGDHKVQWNYFTEYKDKVRVANIIEVAIRHQHDQPWYRREFASQLKSNAAGKTGMSSFGFSGINLPTPVARFVMDLFNTGQRTAIFNRRKILDGSPVIAIFSTQTDDQQSWINTGRTLTSIQLELAIEVVNLRPQLGKIFNSRGFPQLMLRVGQARRVTLSQRRDVSEIWTN